MTDRDALMAALLESPHDDTPRSVLADFLEEAGEGERAAFIRVQVELARIPVCAITDSTCHAIPPNEWRCEAWPGLVFELPEATTHHRIAPTRRSRGAT